jgi:uncharacterized membrane protein YqaE (UPF0057 family)
MTREAEVVTPNRDKSFWIGLLLVVLFPPISTCMPFSNVIGYVTDSCAGIAVLLSFIGVLLLTICGYFPGLFLGLYFHFINHGKAASRNFEHKDDV